MPVITLFGGTYCGEELLAQKLAEVLGYELIDDGAIIARAGGASHLQPDKLLRALEGRVTVFGRFTRDRERAVAQYKATVAELLGQDGLVFVGRAGHLIPPSVTHVLKICAIADLRYRIARAVEGERLSEAQAAKKVRTDDERHHEWTEFVLHNAAWNPSLYDIVIPMDKTTLDQAVELVLENVRKRIVQPSEESIQAVRDLALAARVELVLSREGHDIDVATSEGQVTLTINRHVIMLNRLEEELRRLVRPVEGVKAVETRVGPHFYQSDIYRKHDFEVPSKVLLVDDEREFVQTLSERLSIRDVDSAIAATGEEALAVIADDEPEVMVLDLKMPGIDGIEVLRRVKRDHPAVEVIILTGHGSDRDEEVCRELGAFAYLHKPVDIDALSETMKAAYQRIRERRGETGGEGGGA